MYALSQLALLTAIAFICSALKLDIITDDFDEKNGLLCTQLVCVENITEDTQLSNLINMSVFTISERNGKKLMASISENSTILRHNSIDERTVEGNMTKYYSELVLNLSSECGLDSYNCEIYFTNKLGKIIKKEKSIDPPLNQKNKSSLLLMKLKAKTANYDKTLIVNEIGDRSILIDDRGNQNSLDMEASRDSSLVNQNDFNVEKAFSINHNGFGFSYDLDMFATRISNLAFDVRKKFNQIENMMNEKIVSVQNDIISSYKSFSLAWDTLTSKNTSVINNHAKDYSRTLSITEKLGQIKKTLNQKVSRVEISQPKSFFESLDADLQEMITNHIDNLVLLKTIDQCQKNNKLRITNLMMVQLNETKITLCDTQTDGGGWVVIQRRVVGDISFIRTWAEYREGFGSISGDFWIGNNWISYLTNKGYTEMRIEMSYKGSNYYAVYTNFKVENEANAYRMTYTTFNGNTKDDLSNHKGMKFSTIDRDNDIADSSCATTYKGGWWYNNCHNAELNGIWGSVERGQGINWHNITSNTNSLDFVEMKVRKP